MTRWSKKDLTGILLDNQKKLKVISGKWWNFRRSWTTEIVKNLFGQNIGKWIRARISVKATLPVGKWNAQWMQSPTSEEGALNKT